MGHEKEHRVHNHVQTVQESYADVTLRLVEEHGDEFGPLTPEKEKKLRRKLYFYIMGLMSVINIVLFVSIIHSKGNNAWVQSNQTD